MDHNRMIDQDMAELKDLILKMGVMVQGLIHKSVEALKNQDNKLAQEVVEEDEKVDQLQLEVDEKSIQLIALRQPEASDLRFITTGMRIANDLERIGDLSEDIAQRAIDLSGQPLLKPLIDIPQMAKLSQNALSLVLDAFVKRDAATAHQVWEIERQIDDLRDRVSDELLEIMTKDAATVSRAFPLVLVSRHLERICDHATNIAEDIVYMVEGKVVKHGGRGEN